MAKKKKTYKTSGKPKVAAMNEYIYKNIRESDYKVNRPGKPKKIYKQQIAKRTNLKVYKASPAELARSKYKGPKFSKLPGASKPMPTTVVKGFKVGDPKYVPKAPYAPEPGYKAPSQQPVTKQRLKGPFKPTGKMVKVKEGKKFVDKPGSSYQPKLDPLKGYGGKSSPINQTINRHVWTWKGWQRPRQGRREASPQGAPRQHPGHHQARDPPSRSPWRCEAYLRPHLRGDPLGPQGVPRERDPRRRDLH